MYRYSNNSRYLSTELRDHYEENGFIVLRNLVDHGILDECRQRFIEFCDGTVKQYTVTVMKDLTLVERGAKGQYAVNKIQDFIYDDIFIKYVNYGPLVDVVESIVGPNVTGVHSMLINKPPDTDVDLSLHPLHQDLHYFSFRPPNSVVCSWTAMEHVDERNGCLYVLPGTHKAEQLYKHRYMKNNKNKVLYHGVDGFNDNPRINLVMEKGDTVFFHPLLLHGSGPNVTTGFRKAISCHYVDSSCHFIDVQGTDQEEMANEFTRIARKKFQADFSFSDVWRIKSLLLRGNPGKFQELNSKL